MLKRKLGALFLITCLSLTTVTAVLGNENKQVIIVAGDGSGDYNCNGKDDQVQINQALDYAANHGGAIVHLKGPHIYFISDSLRIGSGTILEGDYGVKIKLAQGLSIWGGGGCTYKSEKAMLMVRDNSASGITIRSLTVDGSQSDYYPKVKLGNSCFNMATLIGCNGLTIQDVTFMNGCNDAMLIALSSNVMINSVTVDRPGHDCLYAYNVNGIVVKNCKFINRANSSTRFDTITSGVFATNDCTTSGGGYAGLELENKLINIECSGNYFHDMPWGIARVHTKEKNVVISGNRYVNVKNGVLK
jgi:Right handed beta helix region